MQLEGFIVQLRSLDDHLPLPGITIGDIGVKFGNGAYNTMDNGVLRFEHVRIPRSQMLMRLVYLIRIYPLPSTGANPIITVGGYMGYNSYMICIEYLAPPSVKSYNRNNKGF